MISNEERWKDIDIYRLKVIRSPVEHIGAAFTACVMHLFGGFSYPTEWHLAKLDGGGVKKRSKVTREKKYKETKNRERGGMPHAHST